MMIQLRATTTPPHSMFSSSDTIVVDLDSHGVLTQANLKGRTAYFHDRLETLAGFDIPVFIDGDMGQLDLPVDEQDILVMLPSGNYPCIATLMNGLLDTNAYYITLKEEQHD